jgi:hypothetical protein
MSTSIDKAPTVAATSDKNKGFKRLILHLRQSLCLSEAEAQRILSEISKAILLSCELEGSVRIPRFGKFNFVEQELVFVGALIAREYARAAYLRDEHEDCAEDIPKEQKVLVNHQDPIKDSLIKYLKLDYSSHLDWVTPLGDVYTFEQVKRAIDVIRGINDDYLVIFVSRVFSSRRRDTVATEFLHSEATVKRRFDAVTSAILWMLIHPQLPSTQLSKLFRN